MARIRDWKGMRDMSARLLKERTGEDVDVWNRRVKKESFNDEKALRRLDGQKPLRTVAAIQESRHHATPDQLHDAR
jgi:hypothetical protein